MANTPRDVQAHREAGAVGGGHQRQRAWWLAGARCTPGSVAVVPQVGHHLAGRQRSGRVGRQEPASGRQADIGMGRGLGRVPPTVEVGTGVHLGRAESPAGAQGQAVAERRRALDLFGHPCPPGRLEHEGARRVGHQKRRVVRLAGLCARTPLAVGRHQLGDHGHPFGRGAGPLEGQADQVHPEEAGRGVGGPCRRPDLLVADGDPALVDPVLRPPEPDRAGQDGGVGTGVGEAQVLSGQAAPRRPGRARRHQLDLAERAVRVFGEERAGRAEGAQRIAHRDDCRPASPWDRGPASIG